MHRLFRMRRHVHLVRFIRRHRLFGMRRHVHLVRLVRRHRLFGMCRHVHLVRLVCRHCHANGYIVVRKYDAPSSITHNTYQHNGNILLQTFFYHLYRFLSSSSILHCSTFCT